MALNRLLRSIPRARPRCSNFGNVCFYVVIVLVLSPGSNTIERFRLDCREVKPRFHFELPEVIFTGIVRQVYSTPGDSRNTYSSDVLVKRVLKGDKGLTDNTVTMDGFGDADVCDTEVRLRDSWIFLADPLAATSLRLNGSLQRVTLDNIQRLSALVNDEPYRRQPPVPDEPCEQKYCPYNGECYVERRTNRAKCRCPSTCPVGDRYDPVCGSDGVTYTSECRMRVETCAKQKRVFVRHLGKCRRTIWSSRERFPRFEL